MTHQPVHYLITTRPHTYLITDWWPINLSITLSQPDHTLSYHSRGLQNPDQWPIRSHIPVRTVMTHQPVNYLITTRSHIILSQPGHAFQLRARPAKSRPATHHASHSSQDRPCQPVNYLIVHANQSIMLSQPSHTFHFTADYLWKPWLMTHQPVNYLITARPHIILSQPGHIFQIRARPAQSRPVTHHVSHSSQDSPYQPVNYLITAKSLIPLYSRLSDDWWPINLSITLSQPGHTLSYHSKVIHSSLEWGLQNRGQWPITSHIPVRTVHVS